VRKALGIGVVLVLVAGAAAWSLGSSASDVLAARGGRASVVDIVATGHHFGAPSEVPSGWTTFRLHNRSGATHFALIERMPEGKTVEDSKAEVVPVFQTAMDLINAGDPAAGFAYFANLPAWYFEIVFMGGPGLVDPGMTAQTTVYLEPGTYVIECYVKTPDGVFHSAHGMIEGLTVTDEPSGAPEPRADLQMTLSNSGLEVHGEVRPGRQTIAVDFAEQMVHGNFLGHDVHLARIDDGTDLDALASWVNWVVDLETPAPVEFLGGAHEMPAGTRAYFTVHLTPGRYALIAEVDDPAGKNLLQTFSVPFGVETGP